jgi:DNA repair protein RAD57
MDIISILPDFPTNPYTHILPSLEKCQISTTDLLTLDALEIAKRAQVPVIDVRRLANSAIEALHHDLGYGREQEEEVQGDGDLEDDAETSSSNVATAPLRLSSDRRLDLLKWSVVSTLDPLLDAALGGGIPSGYVTEITGER